jgi:hypothetical protein
LTLTAAGDAHTSSRDVSSCKRCGAVCLNTLRRLRIYAQLWRFTIERIYKWIMMCHVGLTPCGSAAAAKPPSVCIGLLAGPAVMWRLLIP